MKILPTFTRARELLIETLKTQSYEVKPERWQGISVATKPEAAMREILNWSFQVSLRGNENLKDWRKDILPNLPFADVHFAERVAGEPTNPGEAYKIWPWGHNAEKFRTHKGKFDHTYQERFWPKDAEWTRGTEGLGRRGIRFEYGDYDSLVRHLAEEPLTRQAYLPIWFPEDGTCQGRKPCTLGYHFIQRFSFLHVTYFIRSCDVYRHYNDDVYLTVRLLLDVLDRLRRLNPTWKEVKPGMLTFHGISMHAFVNDMRKLTDVSSKESPAPVSLHSED